MGLSEHRGNPLPDYIVAQLRRQGLSIRRIAEASGVAKSSVEKYCGGLVYCGRPPAPRPGRPDCLGNGDDDLVDANDDDPGDEPTAQQLAEIERGQEGSGVAPGPI